MQSQTRGKSNWAIVLGSLSLRRNLNYLWEKERDRFGPLYLMRGLGMVWVIIAHCTFFDPDLRTAVLLHPYMRMACAGANGLLDMFFVMSGLVVGAMLLKEHAKTQTINVKQFYWRRGLRILPLYYLVLFGLWVSAPPGYSHPLGDSNLAWANVTYINNYISIFDHPFMPWTWSLAIEEQFYLVLPWALLFALKSPRRFFFCIVAALIASLLIRAGIVLFLDVPTTNELAMKQAWRVVDLLYTKSHSRFAPFVLGVAAAYLFHRTSMSEYLLKRPRLVFFGSMFAVACLVFPLLREAQMDYPEAQYAEYAWQPLRFFGLVANRFFLSLGSTWLMLMILMSAPGFSGVTWFANLRIWLVMGRLSYAAYLIHPVVLTWLAVRLTISHPLDYLELLRVSAIGVPLTLGCSLVLYLLIERPAMNLRDDFAKPAVQPVPQLAA